MKKERLANNYPASRLKFYSHPSGAKFAELSPEFSDCDPRVFAWDKRGEFKASATYFSNRKDLISISKEEFLTN